MARRALRPRGIRSPELLLVKGLRRRGPDSRISIVPHQTCGPASAERRERRPQLGTEELRLLPRREVSARVDLVEVDEVAIGATGPCLRGSVDILGKYRD